MARPAMACPGRPRRALAGSAGVMGGSAAFCEIDTRPRRRRSCRLGAEFVESAGVGPARRGSTASRSGPICPSCKPSSPGDPQGRLTGAGSFKHWLACPYRQRRTGAPGISGVL